MTGSTNGSGGGRLRAASAGRADAAALAAASSFSSRSSTSARALADATSGDAGHERHVFAVVLDGVGAIAALVVRGGDVVEQRRLRLLAIGALELLGGVEELAAVVEQRAGLVEALGGGGLLVVGRARRPRQKPQHRHRQQHSHGHQRRSIRNGEQVGSAARAPAAATERLTALLRVARLDDVVAPPLAGLPPLAQEQLRAARRASAAAGAPCRR